MTLLQANSDLNKFSAVFGTFTFKRKILQGYRLLQNNFSVIKNYPLYCTVHILSALERSFNIPLLYLKCLLINLIQHVKADILKKIC
jgi:hypothetical protein